MIMSQLKKLVFLFICAGVHVVAMQISVRELVASSPSNLSNAISLGLNTISKDIPIPEDLKFTVMEGGLSSSKLYHFTLNDKKYVLRILDPKRLHDTQITYKRRTNEVYAHMVASSINLAPKLVYSDPDALIIIMKFLDGHTLSTDDLNDKNTLQNLGIALKKLHSHSCNLPYPRSQLDRVRKHYTRSRLKKIAVPSCFEDLYNEFLEESKSHVGLSFCHGDLNPKNILVCDSQIYFIDWPGSALDNPYADLGYLCLLSGMTKSQEKVFLEAYHQKEVTEKDLRDLKTFKTRTCFLTATVWFDFSETIEDQLIPIDQRVELLDKRLNSPNLKRGLEYISLKETVSPLTDPAKDVQLFALGFLKEYILLRDELYAQKKTSSEELVFNKF